MTEGILGVILCPMLDDNFVYSVKKDPEEKNIYIVESDSTSSIKRKFDHNGIPYSMVSWDDVVGRIFEPAKGFSILICTINLGLHAKPEVLKSTVEDLTIDLQPFVDAIAFYLGTCGNFDWNIPKWCEEKGFKPSLMFTDENGCLCHDCVGVNISGGPRYTELQKKYTGHFYLFPAMANNFDEFMKADAADTAALEESLTDEMREVLGIEKGPDGYLRWLLAQGDYRYILTIDTGIGERENFEKDTKSVAERTGLKVKVAEPGWANLGPTDAIYNGSKALLSH